MPSFDITSELNIHEVTNGVDQANRVLDNRFDFKNSGARFNLNDGMITLTAPEEFQLNQMMPILQESLSKRGVDLKSLRPQQVELSIGNARQNVLLIEGIDKEISKKIIQIVKTLKNRVQVSIQGDSLRVTGKKRDDLQKVIQTLKSENIDIPLYFHNLRD